MKRQTMLLLGLVALEGAALAYDALANESRIIRPIDAATYQFRPTDLPLILATVLLAVGVTVFFIRFLLRARKANAAQRTAPVTRRLDPRFGWFGLAGFCGFLGIPAFLLQHQVWPFFFFVFFGFFGFFYEGKLSGTLMDERFHEEQSRAQLTAYKTGFGLLWAVAWLMGMVGSHLSAALVAVVFTVASSLIIALVLFLNSYLLYKYDTEGAE